MHHTTRYTPLETLSVVVVIALSWLIQSHAYTNPDVSWHIWVGSQLLNNTKLYKDILEVNLPLIYYWAIIPNKIASTLHISPLIAEAYLTNLLALASLLLCNYHLYSDKTLPSATKQTYTITSAIILFIIPLCLSTNNIGQKEHKFLILTLPYLTYLLTNRPQETPVFIRLLTTITAAIGFSVKPHFALIWVTMELTHSWLNNKKPWKSWETWLIGITGLLYAIACMMLFPEYIEHIIPLAKTTYLMDIKTATMHITAQLFLLFQPLAIPLILTVVIGLTHSTPQAKTLSTITIAAIIATISQQKALDYQLLPTIAYTLLIISLIIPTIVQNIYNEWKTHKKLPNNVAANFLIIFLPITLLNWCLSALPHTYNNQYIHQTSKLHELKNVIEEHNAQNSTIILARLPHAFPLVHHANITWHLPMSSIWPIISPDAKQQEKHLQNLEKILQKTSPKLLVTYSNPAINYYQILQKSVPITQILQNYTHVKTLDSPSQTLKIWAKNEKNL